MPSSKNKKRVLIAEDERPLSKALSLKLKSEGFEVDAVYNGEEAIGKIDEQVASKKTYDLLILDIVMPIKDGFDVLEHIKKKKINTPPVFVLSNLSQEEDRIKAESLGATEFVIKSNTPLKEIVEKIKSNL